jgi:hypothetical protein
LLSFDAGGPCHFTPLILNERLFIFEEWKLFVKHLGPKRRAKGDVFYQEGKVGCLANYFTQPDKFSSTICRITAMPGSLAFKQGT